MLTGVFVQRFVELADQLFEDRAHHRVRHAIRMKIDILKALQHLEEESCFAQPLNRVVEVELLQYVAHILAEPGDVVAQIGCEIGRVCEQLLEIVSRGVVEREPGCLS